MGGLKLEVFFSALLEICIWGNGVSDRGGETNDLHSHLRLRLHCPGGEEQTEKGSNQFLAGIEAHLNILMRRNCPSDHLVCIWVSVFLVSCPRRLFLKCC